MQSKITVSVCIPAYNEGKNIRNILRGLMHQRLQRVDITRIIVVCSGCTDDTIPIVERYKKKDSRIDLIVQPERNGKASAINAFLETANEEVVVIESADTVPFTDCIEKLCAPFIDNAELGMTGGAPIPINDPNTFLGYIIHSWWWFHRNIPRFGEIIAFRNMLPNISETTAVDEAYIQAILVKKGYSVVHIDTARVHNKGPEHIYDLIRQRRRIFNGHSRLYQEQNVKIDHMTKSSMYLLVFKYKIHSLKELVWLICGILIEIWSRMLGAYDSVFRKVNPYVWDTAKSTKNLRLEEDQLV